ncbi:hypothetical protein NHX12_024895, partial [Muraenolepis orangiensis]
MKLSDGRDEPGDLEARLATKEREWRELQTLRVQQLESSLKDAREQLSSLRQRFKQLRDDFQYNLSVLEDRDRELERYDTAAAKAQTVESARQEELSQLRIQVAKLVEQRTSETQEREQELRRSQLKATQHRVQLERLQGSMAGDIQKQREDYEGMKRNLERRIQEVEGELALQRQEMTADFDHALRLREHEFNLLTDSMRTEVKLLSKETEFQSQAQQEAAEALQASQELSVQTQAELQRAHLEHTETSALRDNRIKELDKVLKIAEAKRQKEKEEHIKKRQAVERALRERDGALAAQQEALRLQIEAAEAAAAQTLAGLQDQQRALVGRDQTIERLQGESETIRCNWDKYIKQVSKETVARDTELLAVQQTAARLKSELDKRRQETERFQQQLSAGLQREQALEQRRVQVQAELKERDRELDDASVLLQAVTEERDQALQGVPVGPGPVVSEQISRLQEQNSSLRAVVAQMRKDMEGLGSALSQPATRTGTGTQADAGAPSQHTVPPAGSSDIDTGRPEVTPEYARALEREVSELKTRCRTLEEPLEGATTTAATTETPPALRLAPVAPENTYMQNHIRSLNETIGLRQRLAGVEMELEEVRGEKGEDQRGGHTLNDLETVALGNQSEVVGQLREENLTLRRSLFSPGGLKPGAGGVGRGDGLLQAKLKQAARCIARLTRDKQQLIAMGNRLRAQLHASGPD